MSEIQTKIKLYCEANKKTAVFGYHGNVRLANNSDGKGDYIESWTVDGLTKPTDKQLASYKDWETRKGLDELRPIRNELLAQSDWTQNRDVTLSNDADWKTYRQELRDITKTYKSLEDVKWPEKPE
tara:strand:- start:81 stop:458 length:378 start_codon:yes stop_codon:yes gene_type:complete